MVDAGSLGNATKTATDTVDQAKSTVDGATEQTPVPANSSKKDPDSNKERQKAKNKKGDTVLTSIKDAASNDKKSVFYDNSIVQDAGEESDDDEDDGEKNSTISLRLDLNLDVELKLQARVHGQSIAISVS